MPRHVPPLVALALSLAIAAGCAEAPPEQQFSADTVAALGGRERILAVRTIVMEGNGNAANLGQDMTWEAEGQQFELTNYRRIVDLSSGRERIEQTRTPNFLYFQGPRPQRQILGLDGEVAYTIAPGGRVTRVSETVRDDRAADFYHHPLTLVRALLDASAAVSDVRDEGPGRTATVTIAGRPFTVRLDGSGRPISISSRRYHPNLGDVTVETSFSNYQQVEGLQLPAQSRTQVDGRTILELQLDRHTINGDGTDLGAPAEAVSAQPPAPDPPKVEVVEVAAGVWLLAGQSHHSAVVEFDDHLMLIEAPQSERRTQAVIAAARELAPSKPLTELVVSHHHFDHTAGLRAAIAEGLTVITHARNAAFVQEMARRSHTRRPDALEKNPRPVSVRTVSDALTLRDGAMEVQLYEISGNPHAETLLMVYLPRQRLLIEADAYSPGGSYHPYAANLLQNIERRQLAVERIVPLHGTAVTLADLRKDVAAQ